MTVPGGAVVMLVTWHELQPIALNTLAPAFTAAVIGPRGGTFDERIKRANASMSFTSSGSGTVSNAATDRPFEVFSVGNSRLVMPISFKYASPANDSRLACCVFQPKRPKR